MNQQPPINVNFSITGGRLEPLPQALWKYFCDKPTAEAMLSKCASIDPQAALYDLLDYTTPLPPNIGRLPYVVMKSDPTSTVSAYLIVGAVALKGLDNPPALLAEYAAWLADTDSGAISDSLDLQAQNLQGHVGKSKLFSYVSPFDPEDSDCYWADSAVLGGLAR